MVRDLKQSPSDGSPRECAEMRKRVCRDEDRAKYYIRRERKKRLQRELTQIIKRENVIDNQRKSNLVSKGKKKKSMY